MVSGLYLVLSWCTNLFLFKERNGLILWCTVLTNFVHQLTVRKVQDIKFSCGYYTAIILDFYHCVRYIASLRFLVVWLYFILHVFDCHFGGFELLVQIPELETPMVNLLSYLQIHVQHSHLLFSFRWVFWRISMLPFVSESKYIAVIASFHLCSVAWLSTFSVSLPWWSTSDIKGILVQHVKKNASP